MAGCFERSVMADWHPILAARETSPGHWYSIDGLGKPYGQIRFVKRGNQVGYRADWCDAMRQLTEFVGYYLALMPATAAVHSAFLRSRRGGCPERHWDHSGPQIEPERPTLNVRPLSLQRIEVERTRLGMSDTDEQY
jgi:hypothetical protein